jgi:hypothetical protein
MQDQDKYKFVEDFINSSSKASDPSAILENSKVFYERLMKDINNMIKEKDFEGLQDTLQSISQILQSELGKVCKEKGISMEELQKILQNPLNYKSQDWNSLKDLKEDMKSDFSKFNKDKKDKIKKKKNKKIKGWAAV